MVYSIHADTEDAVVTSFGCVVFEFGLAKDGQWHASILLMISPLNNCVWYVSVHFVCYVNVLLICFIFFSNLHCQFVCNTIWRNTWLL